MEYRIIQIDIYDLDGASQAVELLLSKGWELQGWPAVVTGSQYLYQTLTRKRVSQ